MEESWFKVTRADWVIQDQFESIWTASGGPVEAALFGKRDVRAKATDFYFTPAAARIASDLVEKYGAVPCQPPDLPRQSGSLTGLSLLVGDQRILERS
jgi:hypothetical protein